MPLDVVVSPNRAERRKQDSNRGYYEIKPLRYTVRDVSTLLRCTKVFVYQLIKKGALRAQGSRRKLWVTAESLERYVASLPEWRP
jgi:excisionase family DNA binding protein